MVLQGSFSLLLSQSALWWWELLSQQNSCLQLVTWKAPRENFCYYLSLHDLNCLHLKHMTVTAVKSRAWWCLGEKNMKFWSLVGFSCHGSAAGAEGLPALFKSKPQKSVSVSTRSVSDVPVSLVGLHICSSLTSVLPQFCLNTRNVFHLHSQQVFSFFLSFFLTLRFETQLQCEGRHVVYDGRSPFVSSSVSFEHPGRNRDCCCSAESQNPRTLLLSADLHFTQLHTSAAAVGDKGWPPPSALHVAVYWCDCLLQSIALIEHEV